MQTGVKQGMQLMDDALYRLLQLGFITPQTALERAYDRSKFADIEKMRQQQVNWDDFIQIPDDRHKKRMLEKVGVVVLERRTKQAKPIPRDRVPFLFYQTRHGVLPEDEIYRELIRLYPEIASGTESHGEN